MSTAAPRKPARRRGARAAVGALAIAAIVAGSACSNGATGANASLAAQPTDGDGDPIRVVAAENFWGSLAEQLGGDRVEVTSIIDSPDADPHDYEPTAADARDAATARYAIVNGAGYDAWAEKLLASNPDPDRTVLDIGKLVGVEEGGNPHLWYSPDYVHRVIHRITEDYKEISPADAAYFDRQKNTVETKALARYDQLVSEIRQKYGGTPIGASESIVTPLAEGLDLKVLTPESFLDAISEGVDPTGRDKAVVDRQIAEKEIKVYVYNSQNSTPDVRAQVEAARGEGIPVATVTETLTPAGASFQEWQVAQLQVIRQALAEATGR
ncbi:zinc ABC transporter substrate-binding protein [Streptomyces sp. NPDC045431]|uniref:metal ABC transporter solute-binding protein, Zn/Mn family n=1 Tax=Streptomyces sp. NPDC045431 TaxID=3155613 RepID=UPI003403428A